METIIGDSDCEANLKTYLACSTLLVILLIANVAPVCARKPPASYKYAVSRFNSGDLQGAQDALAVFLKRKPKDQNGQLLMGLVLLREGMDVEHGKDYALAVERLRESIQYDPDSAYAHSALAKALFVQGDREGARKECARAAVLSPLDSGIAAGCGLIAPPLKASDADFWVSQMPIAVHPLSVTQSGVTPPRAVSKPEPKYSAEARDARLQGTSVLWIVVNAGGDVTDAMVVKPAGMQLDQNALGTVLTWKFDPALKNGEPVAVKVAVEVSFRLF